VRAVSHETKPSDSHPLPCATDLVSHLKSTSSVRRQKAGPVQSPSAVVVPWSQGFSASVVDLERLEPRKWKTPFLGRAEAEKIIRRAISRNFRERAIGEKNGVAVVTVTGMVRVGKTRAGSEVPRMIQEMAPTLTRVAQGSAKRVLCEPIYLLIDFSNGYGPGSTIDEQLKVSEALSVRLACHVTTNSSYPPEDVSRVRNLATVFDAIVDSVLAGKDENTVVPIVVHFDEFSIYNRAMQSASNPEPFKDMVKALRAAVMTNPNLMPKSLRAKFEAGKYFVVPVCTGLAYSDMSFNLTEGLQLSVSLPLLNFNDSQEYLCHRYQQIGYSVDDVDRVMNDRVFQIAIADTGGVPGFLDFLVEVDPPSDRSWGELVNDGVSTYMKSLRSELPGWEDTAALMFSSLPVERETLLGDRTVGALADEGYFHLVPAEVSDPDKDSSDIFHVRFVPALLRLRERTKEACSVSGLLPRLNGATAWTWQQYEKFNAYFTAAVLGGLCRWHRKLNRTITIGDILRAAVPANAPELGLELNLPSSFKANQITEETQQVLPPKSADKFDLSDYETVHLCAFGNGLVDAYVNLKAMDGTFWTLCFQYKHTDWAGSNTPLTVDKINKGFNSFRKRMTLARTQNKEKWQDRNTLYCYVSNRELVGDLKSLDRGQDRDRGPLVISRDQLQTYLHVFAGRGLVEPVSEDKQDDQGEEEPVG